MALWEEINPAELTAFTREAYDALDVSPYAGVLPNLLQDQVKFTWRVNENLEDVAQYGEFDTEASIGRDPGGEEKTMRLLPVSRKLRLSEYEQVSDPERARGLAEDKSDRVVRYVLNRLNLARGETLVTGRIALNENGIKQNVDFGRDANQTLVTPSELWNASGADPVANLRAWADQIAEKSGVRPSVAIMSTRAFTALAATLAGAGYIANGAPVVSAAAVAEVMSAYGLPTPTVDDSRVGSQRLVPDHVVILAAGNGAAGATVHGPTVEASDPRYNLGGREPGIVAGVYAEDDPPVKWVLGKAVALPVLANPDTTLSATVLPEA